MDCTTQEENEMKRDRDDSKLRPLLLSPAIHRKAPVQPSAARDGMDVSSGDFGEWKIAFSTPSGWLRMWRSVCVTVVLCLAAKIGVGQTTIASKQNHDFHISLTSKSGKLVAEKDEYCALFNRTRDDQPTVVGDVFLDFAQQVGRIRESPRKFPLFRDSFGRYCGTVDLGQKYDQEVSYYVAVHYTDRFRKRRSCRFFLTMK
jgi:hypothetical protein